MNLVNRMRLQAEDLHVLNPVSETVKCLSLGADRIVELETHYEEAQKAYADEWQDTLAELAAQNVALKAELEEAKKDAERLKDIIRHEHPIGSYNIRISKGDFHTMRIFGDFEKAYADQIASNMVRDIDSAALAKEKP